MLCPFPGMDPYLEDPTFWSDFHQRFITYWCDALADQLPETYEVRIEERLHLVELSEDQAKLLRPDLAVLQRELDRPFAGAPGGTLTLEPVTLSLPVMEEVRDAYVRIIQRSDRKLVTVLELLSPSNKREPGRGEYLAKRNALMGQRINLVELDLLLGGQRLPMAQPLPAGDYYAFVFRGTRRGVADVFAWSLRQPVPPIPIPLRAPDPDLVLNLGAVFATAYERGRYARSLHYNAPLHAPLSAEARGWAEERVRSLVRSP